MAENLTDPLQISQQVVDGLWTSYRNNTGSNNSVSHQTNSSTYNYSGNAAYNRYYVHEQEPGLAISDLVTHTVLTVVSGSRNASNSSTKPDLLMTDVMFMSPPRDQLTELLNGTVSMLRTSYRPGVIAAGILGGLMSMIALSCPLMCNLPAAIYLAAATTIDCLHLADSLVMWLGELGYPVYSTGIVCHATYFVEKVTGFLSVWYLVGYSVNMLIVMRYPHAERQLCTIFKAKVVCLVLGIVAIVVYMNISLIVHVRTVFGTHQLCLVIKDFQPTERRLARIDVFVNFLLPFVSSAAILVLCGVQCYRDRRNRRHGPHRPPQRSIHVECDVESGLRLLYFSYVLTNILLTLPHNLMMAIFTLSELTLHPLQWTFKRHLVLELTKILYETKFAANFVVFVLAWRGFRSVLLVLFNRMFRRKRGCGAGGGKGCEEEVGDNSEDGIALCHKTKVLDMGKLPYYNA